MQNKLYNIIIVGAGSSGSILANRLSANKNLKVALIEAGPKDNSPIIQWPAAIVAQLGQYVSKYGWKDYETIQEPYINNKKVYQPRGKTLGGSSSMNAMIYMRGDKSDYDKWVELGCKNWGYEDVLPYFIKSENNDSIQDQYHGTNGELNVSGKQYYHQLCDDFIQAGIRLGYPENKDFNGESLYGVGRFQRTQKDGERFSSSKAFLWPIMKERQNLDIITDCHVLKVNMDKDRATGIQIQNKNGNISNIQADNEVILSAGAINSPQLLQLSGIGNKQDLQDVGIECVNNIQGVGQNLHDHPDVVVNFLTNGGSPFNVHPLNVIKQTKGMIDFVMNRKGMFSSNFAEVGGFIKSQDSELHPDIQFHFTSTLLKNHARDLIIKPNGAALHTCLLQPKSRGHIKLNSKDPLKVPDILMNYMKEEQDLEKLAQGLKQGLQIINESEFKQKYQNKLYDIQESEKLYDINYLKQIVQEKCDTIYHPVGSCKMGTDDLSVVDPEDLKVYNTQNLRVVDASIMPQIVSGNTNAPCIMIGEKISEKINEQYK